MFPPESCARVQWLFSVASNREVHVGIARPSAHVSSKCLRREEVVGGVVFKSVRRHSEHRWELQRRRYHHVWLLQMIGTAACCCSAAANNSFHCRCLSTAASYCSSAAITSGHCSCQSTAVSFCATAATTCGCCNCVSVEILDGVAFEIACSLFSANYFPSQEP